MSDVDILITNRAALDEALEIHPFDEESQIELLLDFIATLDVDDEFQVFVLNAAHAEKKLHDAGEVHAVTCDMDEDCSCAPACGDPKCPGWCHCESDTYGFQVDICDDCWRAGLHPEFRDPIGVASAGKAGSWSSDLVVAAHDKTCDCNMGYAKCAPKTKGVRKEFCYASKAEQAADFARRDAIAMKLKEQGRL